MKKFFIIIGLIASFICILLAPITESNNSEFPDIKNIPHSASEISLRANTAALTDSYFGYEYWSYGKLNGGTVQQNLESIEEYRFVADYTKALVVDQGTTSTTFGFIISGWASTSNIPQYSTFTGIRVTLGIWTKSLTQTTNGISNVRMKISLYKAGAQNKQYETVIVSGQTQNRLYVENIRFNSVELLADLNSGYNIHWIEISAYTTYIPWNRDALYLDQLLVDFTYQPPTPPAAPVLTRTSPQFDPNVQLSWTTPQSSAPITVYRIFRNGTFLVSTSLTTFTDTSSKTLGQQFYYTITAVSNLGESVHSNAVSLLLCRSLMRSRN